LRRCESVTRDPKPQDFAPVYGRPLTTVKGEPGPSAEASGDTEDNNAISELAELLQCRMFRTLAVCLVALSFLTAASADDRADKAAIEKTNAAVRAAFARGDIPTILAYHHPDVTKALAYNRYLVGRSALETDLRSTFENHRLEFLQNDIEILSIHGDIATEQILFSVKGTPKKDGAPFLFKGRTMLILIRYEKSPTGWATLREIVQPAPEGQ
jgi:ketosteroid isomerase-like protein